MSATPELAALKGARAVQTTEVDEGSFLSETLIKLLTGNDTIAARHLYGEPMEFVPSFKLFIAGNHKAVIRGTDHGIWRRIHMIPFAVTIPSEDRDPDLLDKLEQELPGILNWALEGCREWQNGGLRPPAAVIDASAEYREEMDLVGGWLADRCDKGASLSVSSSTAYFDYQGWATASGLRPWSATAFGRSLKERFKCRRVSSGVIYDGFALRTATPQVEKAKVVI